MADKVDLRELLLSLYPTGDLTSSKRPVPGNEISELQQGGWGEQGPLESIQGMIGPANTGALQALLMGPGAALGGLAGEMGRQGAETAAPAAAGAQGLPEQALAGSQMARGMAEAAIQPWANQAEAARFGRVNPGAIEAGFWSGLGAAPMSQLTGIGRATAPPPRDMTGMNIKVKRPPPKPGIGVKSQSGLTQSTKDAIKKRYFDAVDKGNADVDLAGLKFRTKVDPAKQQIYLDELKQIVQEAGGKTDLLRKLATPKSKGGMGAKFSIGAGGAAAANDPTLEALLGP